MQQVTIVEEPRLSNPAEICCLAILAIIFPPIAVALVDGCGINLCINILLFIFTFWLGAVIHALFVIALKSSPSPVVKETTYITQPRPASMV